LDNGRVKCWGLNSSGQLGQGDTIRRGDQPGEMGNALAPIDLGTGRTATSVTEACALLDNGSVKCWGLGNAGRLGAGDDQDRGDEPGEMGDALPAVALGAGRSAVAVSSSGLHACALLDNGTVKCWGLNHAGQL